MHVTRWERRTSAARREVAAFFESCEDSVAQQTPAWHDVIEHVGDDEGTWLCCRQEGRLVGVLPAYLFRGSKGAILVSCCQAGPLGGVACLESAGREAVYEALVAAFEQLAREWGCRVATLITNPFRPDEDLCSRFFSPNFVLENRTHVLDLHRDLDEDAMPIGGSRSLRRNLKRALASGLMIDEEQSLDNVERWYEIHSRRHGSMGLTPLPIELFIGALEHAVPASKARFFFVREPSVGRMVAGGLYLTHQQLVDSLMPAFDIEYVGLMPHHALAHHVMVWARNRDLRHFNWQPSPPGSGVERFKKSWGGEDRVYQYQTRVIGDPSPLLDSTPEELSRAYRWHYVLPFDRLRGRGDPAAVSSRVTAWEASESGKAP